MKWQVKNSVKKYGKIYVGLPNDDANVIFNEEDD